VAGAGE
jgi:hypothetical protein